MDKCGDLPYDIPFHILSDFERAKVVTVQVPPGLRPYSDIIAGCVRSFLPGTTVMVQLDPVFGACDLYQPQLASIIKSDLIVHIGHTPYPTDISSGSGLAEKPRIVFLPALSKVELTEALMGEALEVARNKGLSSIAVVGTAQHTHHVRQLQDYLSRNGIDTVIPRGIKPFFMDGQVIGCDYRLARSIATNIDGFVYVGGGLFHPLGLYLSTFKPVVVADPYQGRSYDLTPIGERTLKKRLFRVMRAMDMKKLAIIVGLKTGQYRPWLVRRLTDLAQKNGVRTFLYVSDRLTTEDLRSLPRVDAISVTSCPRLPIDDFGDFEIPVLTPGETRMALEKRLEPYIFPW